MTVNTMTMGRAAVAGVGVALLAGLVGVGATAVASAAPSSTITVQDQGHADGARVDADGTRGDIDTDGTQGSFKQATDGNATGPIEDAIPQYKAK